MTCYTEDDYLPISALQHYVFCPRQCGLIHVEQAWSENLLTAQGRQMHDLAHEGPSEARGDFRIVRGLRLCSRELGLTGQADVVELRPPPEDCSPDQQAVVPGQAGKWVLHPVEYKRGKPKAMDCDRVQLCAQAICLEEMLTIHIVEASIFYGKPRRRELVTLDERLRRRTREAARDVHEMIRCGQMPPPVSSSKCRSCSLLAVCLPTRTGRPRAASLYLERQIGAALEPDPPKEPTHEDA